MYFLPIPQYNDFHSPEVTTSHLGDHEFKCPLAEDFSGLEKARGYEKPGGG